MVSTVEMPVAILVKIPFTCFVNFSHEFGVSSFVGGSDVPSIILGLQGDVVFNMELI